MELFNSIILLFLLTQIEHYSLATQVRNHRHPVYLDLEYDTTNMVYREAAVPQLQFT